MEIENKLDEDFLFYLGFTTNYFHNLKEQADIDKCQVWLQKLCGETIIGVENKRNRNIYLSNLVLCMQEGQLKPPFQGSPMDTDISNARQVFGLESPDITEPEWLNDIVGGDDDEDDHDDGRTYVATKTLPDGSGAFAYLAVALSDEEPRWLGGGEGYHSPRDTDAFDKGMEQKFGVMFPPLSDMEKVMARRRNPKVKEKVMKFYTDLLQNINDEIDAKVELKSNETVNALIEQLANDLKKKGEYERYEKIADEKKRRYELLHVLHQRVHARKERAQKLEDALDDLEEEVMPQSFFDASLLAEDKVVLPAAMWEQVINKPPSRKNMEKLQAAYPLPVIEKFLMLLSNYKEDIAMRMQKRHENIVSQMKKDLRKDGEADKKRMNDAQKSAKQACDALADVKKARAKQEEVEKRMEEKTKVPVSAHSQMYDQMRNTLYDTQRNVELEAEKGRILAEHINAVNEQSEAYSQVNEDAVKKVEQMNMEIMKNIKRMRAAINQNEGRLQQLQAMTKNAAMDKGGQEFFFM